MLTNLFFVEFSFSANIIMVTSVMKRSYKHFLLYVLSCTFSGMMVCSAANDESDGQDARRQGKHSEKHSEKRQEFPRAPRGFFKTSVIEPNHPLFAYLDPTQRPSLKRLMENNRFFGFKEGLRPSADVFVHPQSLQNVKFYPQSPLAALARMLFPLSIIPTVNPNNIGKSDPFGKMTPQQLGKLCAHLATYLPGEQEGEQEKQAEGREQRRDRETDEQLQNLYSIFVERDEISAFSKKLKDPKRQEEALRKLLEDPFAPLAKSVAQPIDPTLSAELHGQRQEKLRKFYKYALIERVRDSIFREIQPTSESLNFTEDERDFYSNNIDKFLIYILKMNNFHLLEVPGTEFLRDPSETCFTEEEFEECLRELRRPIKAPSSQRKEKVSETQPTWRTFFKEFSDRGCEKFGVHAAVDMLWKSVLQSPKETLELVAGFAWRKFGSRIHEVIEASGAIDSTQREGLFRVLENPYAKTDYQALVDRLKKSETADGFLRTLNPGEQNLLLFGGEGYNPFQPYGNVTVQHEGKRHQYADCAETALSNLSLFAQLEEQGIEQALNPEIFSADSPLRRFWQSYMEDQLGGASTRNEWAELICRLPSVVYRKGGNERAPWGEGSRAHWAELNPGILNQIRALFHLAGDSESAARLTYETSTEDSIREAAETLSRLWKINIAPTRLNKNGKTKDWKGAFTLTHPRIPSLSAVWQISSNHSLFNVTTQKSQVFPHDSIYEDPRLIGQLLPLADSATSLNLQFDSLAESSPQHVHTFFRHANWSDEVFRTAFLDYVGGRNAALNTELIPYLRHNNLSAEVMGYFDALMPYAHKLLYGLLDLDGGREVNKFFNNHPSLLNDPTSQKLASRVDLSTDPLLSNYMRELYLPQARGLLPQKRCANLNVLIGEIESLPYLLIPAQKPIPAAEAIEILERTPFPQVKEVILGVSKGCGDEDLRRIAQFLPKSAKKR